MYGFLNTGGCNCGNSHEQEAWFMQLSEHMLATCGNAIILKWIADRVQLTEVNNGIVMPSRDAVVDAADAQNEYIIDKCIGNRQRLKLELFPFMFQSIAGWASEYMLGAQELCPKAAAFLAPFEGPK